jgi:hypothetical protein
MWRLTKAIIISWLVGVVCGVGMVIMLERQERIPSSTNASTQSTPQTTASTPASPDGNAR